MAKSLPLNATDALIATLLKAREQALALDEPFAAYLVGMAVKAVEDHQVDGIPPGWDDGVAVDDAVDLDHSPTGDGIVAA